MAPEKAPETHKSGHPALRLDWKWSSHQSPEEIEMTALPQSTRRKLSLLKLAEELGNVSRA